MQSTEGSAGTAAPDTQLVESEHEAAAVPAAAAGGHGAHGGDIHLPPPSIWPITTAGGVALGGLGLVTNFMFSFLGLIIMAWGLIAWTQELRHERH